VLAAWGSSFHPSSSEGNGSIDSAELPFHTHSTCYNVLHNVSRRQCPLELNLQFRLCGFKFVGSTVMTDSPTSYSESSIFNIGSETGYPDLPFFLKLFVVLTP
jgi:hypothetical protein